MVLTASLCDAQYINEFDLGKLRECICRRVAPDYAIQIYLYQYWTVAETQKCTCVDLIILNYYYIAIILKGQRSKVQSNTNITTLIICLILMNKFIKKTQLLQKYYKDKTIDIRRNRLAVSILINRKQNINSIKPTKICKIEVYLLKYYFESHLIYK